MELKLKKWQLENALAIAEIKFQVEVLKLLILNKLKLKIYK